MNVTISEVPYERKEVLARLIEMYEHELSEYTQDDVDSEGQYGYTYFDSYWKEKKRFPYFIKVNNQLAGFILVCDYSYIKQLSNKRMMAEFFVMKKYRRLGIGKKVAFMVFDLLKGSWEIGQLTDNRVSKIFWEKIIKEYTNDNYRKILNVNEEGFIGQLIVFNNDI